MVLARGELDRLEGPGYAARRTELRKAKEAARTRVRQAAASQDEAEENDATEEEVTTRWLKRLYRLEKRTTHLSLKSLCGGGVPSSHPSLGLSVFFLSFF